jgi:hypothetical protein
MPKGKSQRRRLVLDPDSGVFSGAVAFDADLPTTTSGIGWLQTTFAFHEDVTDDVLICSDFEWLEGTNSYVNYAWADWMALAGVTRDGTFRIAVGSDRTDSGITSTDDNRLYVDYDVGKRLLPNTVYTMTTVVDFASQQWGSVTLTGATGADEISWTQDLSSHKLDFPNLAPYDESRMIYIPGLIKREDWERNAGVAPGDITANSSLGYFYSMIGGVYNDPSFDVLFSKDFTVQTVISDQPTQSGLPWDASIIGTDWYKERSSSALAIISNTLLVDATIS